MFGKVLNTPLCLCSYYFFLTGEDVSFFLMFLLKIIEREYVTRDQPIPMIIRTFSLGYLGVVF